MLVAIQAGSLFRGFLQLLSFPVVAVAYLFISEALGIQILIYISFAGLQIRDIEQASRAVLPRFYASDARKESWEVFKRCARKVVVTANPIILVEPFVTEFLGGDKVLGTEMEVDPKTKRATGFVSKPGVLVSEQKRVAIEKEFGPENPDLGIGDRKTIPISCPFARPSLDLKATWCHPANRRRLCRWGISSLRSPSRIADDPP